MVSSSRLSYITLRVSALVRLFTFAFSIVTVVACSTSTAKNEKEAVNEFPGLQQMLTQTGESGGMVRLLTVHGDESPGPGYSRELMDGVVEELGLKTAGPERGGRITRNINGIDFDVGEIRIRDYRERRGPARLRHYELAWFRVTNLRSADVLSADTSGAGDERADYRRQMIYPVQQAICWMLTDHEGDGGSCSLEAGVAPELLNDQIAVVSESLGSAMLFDVLDDAERLGTSDPSTTRVFDNGKGQIHRLASQLPLVTISVARHGFLFVVGDPREGHMGYVKNDNVVRALSCGSNTTCR